MIVSFADKETESLFVTGTCRKFPPAIIKTVLRKLDYLNRARTLQDLQAPPGNHLEALKGNFKGKHSIRINDQFRIVFAFEQGDFSDVEIVDYH